MLVYISNFAEQNSSVWHSVKEDFDQDVAVDCDTSEALPVLSARSYTALDARVSLSLSVSLSVSLSLSLSPLARACTHARSRSLAGFSLFLSLSLALSLARSLSRSVALLLSLSLSLSLSRSRSLSLSPSRSHTLSFLVCNQSVGANAKWLRKRKCYVCAMNEDVMCVQ